MATPPMMPTPQQMPPNPGGLPQVSPEDFDKQQDGKSQDRTPDSAKSGQDKQKLALSEDDKRAVMSIIERYTNRFNVPRRPKIRNVLRAREYTKGRQYVSFDPYTFNWYDPLEALFEGSAGTEDLSIYRYVNNIYQMLELGFVGALSAQVPKARWIPDDPKNETDVQTAKHASNVQAYIERKNNIRRLQKIELMLLWTDGCYFKYTRYIVDADKAGTKQEPIIEPQMKAVTEAGYLCRKCGNDVPESDTALVGNVCPNCNAPLNEADYHPAEMAMVPTIMGQREIPDGLVKMDVFGALHITCAPNAMDLTETPMLKLDQEVETAAIRSSYPEAWTEATAQTSAASDDAARIARQYVYNAIGGRNNLTAEMMPTLSRTWLHSWALALEDNQQTVKRLQDMFPNGLKVVHLGTKFLEASAERMSDHWTWCGSMPGYGLYPPGVGDCALDVQDQYNDCRNIVMEYMDRSATPGGFVNESAVDTRELNGKPNLAGSYTSVKVKGAYAATRLQDLFYQPEMKIAEKIFTLIQDLFVFAELVSGVTPQVFGSGQMHIDTAAGQKQALNTAVTRLAQYLDEQREEHAAASTIGVRLAAQNYDGYIMNVVAGGPEHFTAKYVPVAELQGDASAYPESDAGFPATWAEIRDRLDHLFTNSRANPWLMQVFDEPNNMRMAADYLGFPGMTIPGEATRAKTMQVIQQLMQASPSSRIVKQPVNGQLVPVVVKIPTMHPDPDFDDLDVVEIVLKEWAEENWQDLSTPGGENVRAYFREVITAKQMKAAQDAMLAGPGVAPAGGGMPPGMKASGGAATGLPPGGVVSPP